MGDQEPVVIENSSLFDPESSIILSSLNLELLENFDVAQVHRTRTEMEVSVLNDTKFPTPASRYWQAVREQSVYFNELTMLSYKYRKTQVECKKLARDIKVEKDNLEKELLQIELEEKQFTIKCQRREAKARIREIVDWSDIKQREAARMSPEELSNVDVHQLLSYTKRWIRQSIKMGGGGSPSERQNLLGQLRSGILACISQGLFERLIEDLEEGHQDQIRDEYSRELTACEKKKISAVAS